MTSPTTIPINFTLDTICPWTYLAKRRLTKALSLLPPTPTTFTTIYKPYQLYPSASQAGEDKYAWYKTTRYGDSDEKMTMYTSLMASYGAAEGIKYKFGGVVANTLHAHRCIGHWQEVKGAEVADRFVESLYRQYFEEERHPSSHETLVRAAVEAGVGEEEARAFVEHEEGLMETKMAIREQAGNQVDSVPYIVIEGKRRDYTIEGCREVDEYVATLKRVIKESS